MSGTKFLVAAIDFGSSGVGYAFSFAYQFKTNPIDVHTSIWNKNNSAVTTKLPCVLLFDESKKFDCFGFDAEDKYEDLFNNDEHDKWYFFKGFKMQLYSAVENNEDIREDFKLYEIGGKKMSAKVVFAAAIGYLKDHLVGEIKHRKLGAVEDMMYWVVSVPAIWNDSCKQFMRESAEVAGIKRDTFSIVYEPEAASVYARLLPVDKFVGENKMVVLKTFDLGRKFIVLDAGGGTVDISTQEVSNNGELKIIHKICGGPWGGECVNRQFMKMILELLGARILKKFKRKNGHDLLLLTRSFERKKKTFTISSDELPSIQIPIPYSLIEMVEKKKKRAFAEVIATSKYNEQLRFKRDKLTINSELFMDMFKEPIQNIIHEVRTIFQHERCSDVSAIMMVGGFSESDVLQSAVQKAFSDIEVFIPVDGSLSVLKGAVIYGHNPDVVSSRVCNFTYGIDLLVDFDPKIHSLEKQLEVDGDLVCTDIFTTLFTIDEEVKVGDARSIGTYKTYRTPEIQYLRSRARKTEIFVSDKADPFYTTDEGCRHHATIIVNPPSGQIWPEIVNGRVELQITGTEMVGSFIFNDTGERTAVRFEFLPAKSSNNPNRKRIFDPFYLDL